MLRRISLLAVLMLALASTGCSAFGINHPLTSIIPTDYISTHEDSQLIHAHYETDAGPATIQHAAR